jgi:hypothetical protein
MGLDGLGAIEIDNPDDYKKAKILWEKVFLQTE